MPLDPLSDPLLRAPRSHAPTIAGMTEAANAATPDQLADFVDAIGASGSGGGGNATNLGATASPTGVTVTSDTGNDADLPLATGTNAGLMAPGQHTKLNGLPTAAQLTADQAEQDLAIAGKADASHTHTPAAIGAATAAQGAKADTALQPGVLPAGTTLPAAQVSDATAPGRALLTAADAAAQRTALALGNVNNTADADKPVSTAQALAITAATTADAIADTLEAAATGAPADLARIQSSVSGDRAGLNATQQSQQAAGATTALLAADKSTLLDPSGGPAINIRRYRIIGTLAEVLALTGLLGDEALVTDIGAAGCGVLVRWATLGWRATGNQTLAVRSSVLYEAASTAEVSLGQVTLPTTALRLFSGFKVYAGFQKSGVATSMTCRFRIGNQGSGLGGTVIMQTSNLGAANRSLPVAREYSIAPDNVYAAGAQNLSADEFAGGAFGAAYPIITAPTPGENTTVSITGQTAAATDQPGSYYFRLEGIQ